MTDDADFEQREEDIRLQIVHARQAIGDLAKQRRDRRRAYARDWYAKNREQQAEYQREYRAKAREKDPEKFAQQRRDRRRRWHEKHRDEINAKQREKYAANPEAIRAKRAEHYAKNPEQEKARRRAYYAANREKQLAVQEAWRNREKRRREIGLPVTRLHQLTPDQRLAQQSDADTFFAKTWTEDEMNEAMKSLATPPELLAAFLRDSQRARAAHHFAEQNEELARLQHELTKRLNYQRPHRELEEERMDAIAKDINTRLRTQPPVRRTVDHDPAAPHSLPGSNTSMGMNR